MPETALQAPAPAPLMSFTEDEILFRDNVRQFAEDRVRPLVKEMDEKGVFDHVLIDEFFHLGLMGIEIPEQYSGGGGKFFEAILAVEEMSRVDASAGVIVDVQNTLVNNALLRWGTEDQKKRYLPRMAADTCGAYALSEAGSGSDAFALQTRAELKGSDYVLNGRKQYGEAITDFQRNQFQIAQMATELEAARLMVYNAARMKDAGIPFVKEAAMAKLFCSQVAERVTSLAIEIYGGYGFTKDYPVEKYWRDSKIGKIYEGTSNMQLATIAKLVLGGK